MLGGFGGAKITTKSPGRPTAALATADGIEKLKAAVGKYWRITGRSQADGTFTAVVPADHFSATARAENHRKDL
jgi:hypothetical protein